MESRIHGMSQYFWTVLLVLDASTVWYYAQNSFAVMPQIDFTLKMIQKNSRDSEQNSKYIKIESKSTEYGLLKGI